MIAPPFDPDQLQRLGLDEFDLDSLQKQVQQLFLGPVDFLDSVMHESKLPNDDVIEFSFAGRSNVGKSSLINKLVNRQNIARTSREPGRTQALNLFGLGGTQHQLRLVDMPGYGYAKAPKDLVYGWTKLIENYLKGRVNLRRVLLLIDSRHGIMEKDKAVLNLLNKAAISTRVVLTKQDKLTKQAAIDRVAQTREQISHHASCLPEPLMTSAEKNIGIDLLRLDLAGLIR
ncbi:MAG: ribosome biogenesis GTP-binding protein YihA/YsxC [Alphaproteobacteria bacterium]